MLIAIGEVDVNPLIDGAILMAKGKTRENELDKKIHPDGWGAAYLDEKKEWVVLKSLKAIFNDPSVEDLRKIKTELLIIHARRSTVGNVSINNTHPFQEDRFVFCHNGTIKDTINYNPKFNPKGTTDSEKIFYSILSDIKEGNVLQAMITNLKKYKNYNKINLFLSSKEKTFISTKANKKSDYNQLSQANYNRAIIISSDVLPTLKEAKWKKIDFGDILAIDNKSLDIKVFKK